MKLQRTTMMAQYPYVGTKDFYAASDVDALLARIREAVDAERGSGDRAALDALLSNYLGIPDGSEGGV